MSKTENGGDGVHASSEGTGADPHGQAAMLLIESLLHGLIARSVITVTDAIGFVETASDVRQELGYEFRETPNAMAKSLTILRSIASSLRFDLNGQPLRSID